MAEPPPQRVIWLGSDDEDATIILEPKQADDIDALVDALCKMSTRDAVDRTLYRVETPQGVSFTPEWLVP